MVRNSISRSDITNANLRAILRGWKKDSHPNDHLLSCDDFDLGCDHGACAVTIARRLENSFHRREFLCVAKCPRLVLHVLDPDSVL